MTISVKSQGRPSFKTIDLMCPNCNYEEDRMLDLRDMTDEQVEAAQCEIKCPNCDHEYMEKVWRKAPSMKIGNDRDDHNIKRMQKSFHERFIKKDIDNVRHKHGKLFDDALVSAAVAKAKEK